MQVTCVPLTDFVHGPISAREGRPQPIDKSVAEELERHGLLRIRFSRPRSAKVESSGRRWDGATVAILASGPSLAADDVAAVQSWREEATGRRVIAVNTTFRLAPWADVLYASDARWWSVYGGEVERDFTGELWTCAARIEFANHIEAVDLPGLSLNPRRIHLGGNSGYQAVGLAYLWGASRIVLLGYDMQRGPRGESHHHGKHDGGLPNPAPDFSGWSLRFIQLGADLRDQGVEVLNATRRTALTCFERVPIERAL